MYVLFIVTSFWAYGELLIAVEFAVRARQAGYRPIFLIPPSHIKIIKSYQFSYTVLIPGSGKINRILLQDLEHSYRPRLVILADFLNYHFCERHYGLTVDDLALFSGTVGTFDNFDWLRTQDKLDTYGFRAKRYGSLGLDEYAFRLCACPLNEPIDHADPKILSYALMDQPAWQDEETRAAARAALGIEQEKVLLLTTATWQHTHAAYPRVENFVKLCNRMLEHILQRVGPDTAIISIGPSMLFPDRPPAHFRSYAQLPPAEFARYMAATDLFISSNIGSTTLHRVVLSGIPALVFFSSLYKRDGEVVSAERSGTPFALSPFTAELFAGIEYCYPFRMFPVGWYYFLNPLVRHNPFCAALIQQELFDEQRCVEVIDAALHDPAVRARLRGQSRAYLDQLAQLPTVDRILEQLVTS